MFIFHLSFDLLILNTFLSFSFNDCAFFSGFQILLVFGLRVNVSIAEQVTQVGGKQHKKRDQVNPHELVRSRINRVETLSSLVIWDLLILMILHHVLVCEKHNENA